MMRRDDLSTVINAGDDQLSYRQGTVVSWDIDAGTNEISVGGTIVPDVPILGRIAAMSLRPGDVVGLLGWRDQLFILGMIGSPDTAADVTARGGQLNITNNGTILVRDEHGEVRIALSTGDTGGGQITTFHADGTPHVIIGDIRVAGDPVGQGFIVQKQDGLDLLSAFADPDTGKQEVRTWDHDGVLQVATDKSGSGLARPFADVPMYLTRSLAGGDSDWSLEVPRDAAEDEWVTMWEGQLWVTHAELTAQAYAWETDGSGQIRLQIDNATVGTTHDLTSIGSYYNFGGPVPLAGLSQYTYVRVAIQGRITSSSGRILVRPYGVTKGGTT